MADPSPVFLPEPQHVNRQTRARVRRVLVTIALIAAGLLARRDPLQALAPIRENFDGPISGWRVSRDTAGSGAIQASTQPASSGSGSARLTTAGSNGTA